MLKTLRQNKEIRTGIWKLFNAIVTIVLAWLSAQTTGDFVVVALIGKPVIEAISKYINLKYFGDIGVH